MSWTLEKDFHFEAAHRLPHHEGKCARLHGHSFRGKLICRGKLLKEEGSEAGMLLDYSRMKEAIADLLRDYLDHHDLNETTGLENPTSEMLAKWIFDKVKTRLPELVAVEVQETCTARCTYEEV